MVNPAIPPTADPYGASWPGHPARRKKQVPRGQAEGKRGWGLGAGGWQKTWGEFPLATGDSGGALLRAVGYGDPTAHYLTACASGGAARGNIWAAGGNSCRHRKKGVGGIL